HARAQTDGFGVEQLSLASGSTMGSLPPLNAGAEYTSPDVQVTRISRPIGVVAGPDDSKATVPLAAITSRPRSRAPLVAAIMVAAAAAVAAAYLFVVRGQGSEPARASASA